VVAAKLVAAALIGLVFTASALADSPTVRITSADQSRAVASLLRRSDFGAGWTGGQVPTAPLTAPNCPGFDPKESDLVVTGHADARYSFPPAGVELDQDVQVLKSAEMVEKDFARSISPLLGRCLAYQLKRLKSVVAAARVERIPFPATGSVSAVYRATITRRSGGPDGTLLSDYVFFGEGRVEYEFTVSAPVSARDQLQRFELVLAQILLRRAATGAA
jgi:hypothetical protein